HLLGIQVHEAVMHPMLREGAQPGQRLRLRDLVLMMREDEILAATMKIEGGPEVARRHGGALDVPPRPALAPRRLPEGLARLRGLPESEIERAAFFFSRLDSGARQEILEGLAGELAVRRKALDREVDI